MEFSDINKKHSGDIETNSYENTKTTNATLESAESSKPQQTGQGEGLYEQLRLEGKVNDRKSLRCEEIPKRIKYIIYITFALLIVLYMIVIALIVFVAVPKEKEQGEPHCSKYDFEEKVLEKMVRVEFQMERIKSEVEDSVKTVGNTKNVIDAASKLTDQKLKLLDDNLDKIKSLQNELSDTLNEKKQEFWNKAEKKFATLQNQLLEKIDGKLQEIGEVKDEVITPTFAFKARLDTSTTVATGKTMIFPHVLFNVGDAYNSKNGVFTAPVNGTYMFTFACCVPSSKSFVAGIMVDGIKYTVTHIYGISGTDCNTADTTAVLTAGQRVWLEVLSGSSSSVTLNQGIYRWNTFAGTIIHK
ncbi:uncharacterized protein LOC123540580 isoform X1 [Mercenaria mercenaria]|uniref:uncharacterized protein LOC123540580 isoform X1 n=1 Tax=Mercenaria mercenaria TaxID=6596 RepID=UPI00234E40AA|nr:uncharacterized protein LOC123540580 isoform X1 [Mercenaria mercenaria]